MSTPSFTISPCLPSDLRTCFTLLSLSFGDNAPFISANFPNHSTPTGRAEGTERLQKWQAGDPHATFLKAAEQSPSGEERVLGFAVWAHETKPPKSEIFDFEDRRYWPDEADAEFIRRLWRDMMKPRGEVLREGRKGGVWVLDLLAVHPEGQQRGVGAALVRWGTEKADEDGIEAVVEATRVGGRLYEKWGFQTMIERMRFDVGEEFSDRKIPDLAFMRRPAKGI